MTAISAEAREWISTKTPDERRQVMLYLAAQILDADPTLRTFRDDRNEVVGYLVPAADIDEFERAEITRRLDTPDESLTLDDMMDRAGKLISSSNAPVEELQSR